MRSEPYARLTTLTLALALTGCAVPVEPPVVGPQLPPVPTHLRVCFEGVSALPAADQWTSEAVAEVIATLRTSELVRTRCGRQLLDFYDQLRSGLNGQG